MDWFYDFSSWIPSLEGVELFYLGVSLALGALLAHLYWWFRTNQGAERERDEELRLAGIERRQRELRKQLEELHQREIRIRRLEETLRNHSEELKPQIAQVREWLEEVTRREDRLALREAATTAKSPEPEKTALN